MNVGIFSPNLKHQKKGVYHVHASNCIDCLRYGPRALLGGEEFGCHEFTDRKSVIAFIYSVVMSESGLAEDLSKSDSIADQFYFADCVGNFK